MTGRCDPRVLSLPRPLGPFWDPCNLVALFAAAQRPLYRVQVLCAGAGASVCLSEGCAKLARPVVRELPAPQNFRSPIFLAAKAAWTCLLLTAFLSPSISPALNAIAQSSSCCGKGQQCSCQRHRRVCRCGTRLSPGWRDAAEKCDRCCQAAGPVTVAGCLRAKHSVQVCTVQRLAVAVRDCRYAGRKVGCSFPRAPPSLLS